MTTEPFRRPVAHHLFAGDAAEFAARGEHCNHPGCREAQSIHTLRWYRWEGRVRVVEHFYCAGHGEAFGRRYKVGVGPAPEESGLR